MLNECKYEQLTVQQRIPFSSYMLTTTQPHVGVAYMRCYDDNDDDNDCDYDDYDGDGYGWFLAYVWLFFFRFVVFSYTIFCRL